MSFYGEGIYGLSKYGDELSELSLFRSGNVTGVRKLSIKRKNIDGSFENEFIEITKVNGKNIVIDWGVVEQTIDTPFLGDFNISGVTLQVSNLDREFNVETDPKSIWFGFLNRGNTKLKIDVGYFQVGREASISTVFEGIIDKITINDKGTATIKCLSYLSILNKNNISDLNLTGVKTSGQIINLIFNQDKISEFITLGTISFDNNVNIDTSTLSGTYLDVIKFIALITNTIPKLINFNVFEMIVREPVDNVFFDFFGSGSGNKSDIISINKYDQENQEDVFIKIDDSSSSLSSETSSSTQKLKYQTRVKTLSLTPVNTSLEKQQVLDRTLTEYQYNRQRIQFKVPLIISLVGINDRISIKKLGKFAPDNGMIWDSFNWDDGIVWGDYLGAINLTGEENFLVKSLRKDLQNWQTTIGALEPVISFSRSGEMVWDGFFWDDGSVWQN
jgi:hypothetical protein